MEDEDDDDAERELTYRVVKEDEPSGNAWGNAEIRVVLRKRQS